jgi:hypothetical protein
MRIRIRRRIKLCPGVYGNYYWSPNKKKDGTYSKPHTSISVGRRGATLNVSKRGPRVTLGVPGTGVTAQFTPKDFGHHGTGIRQPLSYSRIEDRPAEEKSIQIPVWRIIAAIIIVIAVYWMLFR